MCIGLHVKYINVHRSACKIHVISFQMLMKIKLLLDRFWKNSQPSNSMKIRPVGAELFHADRQTDIRMLILAFRNFVNEPKNEN
jgi:hypothetical protein